MMRNLNVLTTEESVLSVLKTVTPQLVNLISTICIDRDSSSNSRGNCYLCTESTDNLLVIYRALNSLASPLAIDGRTVILLLCCCKYNMDGDGIERAHLQAQNVACPNVSVTRNYSLADVKPLSEYAARCYATNESEYLQYLEYYHSYFTQQINDANSRTLYQENQMDAANASATVAQSAAIQQTMKTNKYCFNTYMNIPNGIDGKTYPVPDTNNYIYDATSGFLYDPTTGLFNISYTNYFYNSYTQKYLYWDPAKLTYILLPTYESYANFQQTSSAITSNNQEFEIKQPKTEHQDFMENAKIIAKEMERWAKKINQKKKPLEQLAPCYNADTYAASTSGSADIGYSMLERDNVAGPSTSKNTYIFYHREVQDESESSSDPLCGYGGALAYGGNDEYNQMEYIDFENKNKENEFQMGIVHRDMAEEHPMQFYSDPNEPQSSKWKGKYLTTRQWVPVSSPAVSEPFNAENVGNELWQNIP